MITDRRYAHHLQEDTSVNVPLALSILMHALLALGLYFISKPHPPKETTGIQTTLITADMLREMTSQAKQAKQSEDIDNSNTADLPITTDPSETDIAVPDSQPKLSDLIPSVLTPKSNKPKKKSEPIFKKVPSSERKKNTPPAKSTTKSEAKSKPKPKPKTGEPDRAGIEKTKAWAKQQQKIVDDLKKQKKREDDLKRKAKQREKDALAARKAEEKRKQKEKREAEKQRLKNMKKAEAAKDKKLAERRKEIEAAQKKQRAKQEAERKKQAAARRTASLSEGSKKLGGLSEFDNEAKKIKTGMSKAKKQSIIGKYDRLIVSKIKRNWKNPTDKPVNVSVRISLSRSGAVTSVSVNSGDPKLDASIKKAIRSSSPLDVPQDPEIFKEFSRFSFKFKGN